MITKFVVKMLKSSVVAKTAENIFWRLVKLAAGPVEVEIWRREGRGNYWEDGSEITVGAPREVLIDYENDRQLDTMLSIRIPSGYMGILTPEQKYGIVAKVIQGGQMEKVVARFDRDEGCAGIEEGSPLFRLSLFSEKNGRESDFIIVARG